MTHFGGTLRTHKEVQIEIGGEAKGGEGLETIRGRDPTLTGIPGFQKTLSLSLSLLDFVFFQLDCMYLFSVKKERKKKIHACYLQQIGFKLECCQTQKENS